MCVRVHLSGMFSDSHGWLFSLDEYVLQNFCSSGFARHVPGWQTATCSLTLGVPQQPAPPEKPF